MKEKAPAPQTEHTQFVTFESAWQIEQSRSGRYRRHALSKAYNSGTINTNTSYRREWIWRKRFRWKIMWKKNLMKRIKIQKVFAVRCVTLRSLGILNETVRNRTVMSFNLNCKCYSIPLEINKCWVRFQMEISTSLNEWHHCASCKKFKVFIALWFKHNRK